MPDAGTVPVRESMALDKQSLVAWLEGTLPGFSGDLQVHQFAGGQSNPTYQLTTPTGKYVLRRKPPGIVIKGAHDVLREARVMTALADTDVPVPTVVASCDDPAVIGTEFYLMEKVEGRIFWDAAFTEVPHDERSAYFDAMNGTIASLHAVSPSDVGLENFGRSGNFFSRQIGRWTKQYREDDLAGRNEDMDVLTEWLPTVIPPEEQVRLVHGDFRCDNMIFHPHEPKVLAVLDWELATLGEPLSDFAYHAMMYRVPGDIVAGIGGLDPIALGLPTEEEYIAAYCQRTGRSGIENWNFYIAFNLFRLAAIFHGIAGRVKRGTAVSAQAAERAANFPRLARLAAEAMELCR